MKITNKPFAHVNGPHALIEYASPLEMFDHVNTTKGGANSARHANGGDAFFGGQSWDALPALLREGDKAYAKRAKALLNQISNASPAKVQRVRKSRPFGRAVTGAYLAGDPLPARARVKVKTVSAPLTIIINVTSSGMTSASDLDKRGAAISALVQRLAAVRPVQVKLVGFAQTSGVHPIAFCTDFPTAPLDVYRLSWVTASQGFGRAMGFAVYRDGGVIADALGSKDKRWSFSDSYRIQWGRSMAYCYGTDCSKGADTFGADLLAHLRTDGIYIPAAGSNDPSYREMLDTPVQWINSLIERHGG